MKIKKLAKKAAKSIKPPKALKIPPPSAKKAAKNLTPKSKSSSMNMKNLGTRISNSFKSVGNKIKDIFSPQVKVKNNRTQCPKNIKLVKVGFMPGQDAFLTKKGVQIVNLPPGVIDDAPPRLNKSQKKWVDGKKVTDLDRLGRIVRVRATIKPAVANIPIRYRLVIEPGNAQYTNGKKDKTENELGRNERFRHDRHNDRRKKASWKTMHTNDKGVAVGTLVLSQAGKNNYSVEARLPKKLAKNEAAKRGEKTIETKRLVHLKQFIIDNKYAQRLLDVSKVTTAFESSHIDVVPLDGKPKKLKSAKIGVIGNGEDEATAVLNASVRDASSKLDRYSNHFLSVVYVDMISEPKMINVTKDGVSAGPGKRYSVQTLDESDGKVYPLYPASDWLSSASRFEYSNPSQGVRKILASQCSVSDATVDPVGSCIRKITVDLSSLPDGAGAIRLVLKAAKYFANGRATTRGNHVLISTRVPGPSQDPWKTRDATDCEITLVHEIGHKFQMSANGGYAPKTPIKDARPTNTIGPDIIDTHYDDRQGHRGNHCFFPFPESPKKNDYTVEEVYSVATCVMYGSSAATNRKNEFCPHCKKALRKVDLSEGWEVI